MLWKAEGKGKIFSLLSSAVPLSFLPSYFMIFRGFKLAFKSYILVMDDSSRKTFYSSLCKKSRARFST
jgi:hypothetical protein